MIFKRTIRIKAITHFGFILTVAGLFFFSMYMVQKVDSLEQANAELNRTIEINMEMMDQLAGKCGNE